MTNVFRKFFNLTPSKTINIRQLKQKKPIKSIDATKIDLNNQQIFPVLVAMKTAEFNLKNQEHTVFYERENNYANVVITYVQMVTKVYNKSNDNHIFHIKTNNYNKRFYKMLADNGQKNLDNLEPNFEFLNPIDGEPDYKILSLKVSFLTSESILSKKHMLKAHKMLNTNELMVSIPRRGIISICDYNLEPKNFKDFLNMHVYMVKNNKDNLELLCEDIFTIKNNEIDGVLELNYILDVLSDN